MDAAEMGLGPIKLYIGKPNRTMPPEFWAERAMEKIMSISDNSPMPIRDQARAFHEKIQYVILRAVESAINERRARDAFLAEKFSAELAQQIKGDV